jgi:two-component system alkaline phosphatase synthesis response regulator PhoP
LFKVFMIADGKEQVRRLGSELASMGLVCSIDSEGEKAIEDVGERAPDLVLVTIDGKPHSSEMLHLARNIKEESHLPVIALLSRGALDRLDSAFPADDFVVEPWDATEVVARAKRILGRAKNTTGQELIKCGDLTIDVAKYEAYVNNRIIELTFKEYELLRFLASNKGRVFTREALLNEVWGYDYYGGDRTVDVHITRLRSKIENSTHTFIETVRNIGYKFKETV